MSRSEDIINLRSFTRDLIRQTESGEQRWSPYPEDSLRSLIAANFDVGTTSTVTGYVARGKQADMLVAEFGSSLLAEGSYCMFFLNKDGSVRNAWGNGFGIEELFIVIADVVAGRNAIADIKAFSGAA